MTIPKAIEIIDLNLKEAGDKMPPDVKDALELSKEALKRLLLCRTPERLYMGYLLPGETKPIYTGQSED